MGMAAGVHTKKAAVTMLTESVIRYMWSNDVELAHGWFCFTAVLIKPLPTGCHREGGAILGLATIWLRGPDVGGVPVFVCDADTGLVCPFTFGHHVVDAQPHLLTGADALADVVSELVVLITGCGRTEDTTHGVAVFTGGVITLPQRLSQETLTVDLDAFQTHWRGR